MQLLSVDKQPSRWPLPLWSHLPNPSILRVPCLHFFDPRWQFGLWASQFQLGWLHLFHMRGRTGYFLSVVRVWSDRPTARRAALLPIFLWLFPTISSTHSIGFYWLFPPIRCFEGIAAWNIGSWYEFSSKKFWRWNCQIVGRCQLWLFGGFETGTRYSSTRTSWHLCLWCLHRPQFLPTCWSNQWQQVRTSFERLQWVRVLRYPSPIVRTARNLSLSLMSQHAYAERVRIFGICCIF